MKVPFLDLKIQHRQIEHEVLPMLTEAMQTAQFIGGPNVEGFEQEFAAFCNTRYCIGVNSGTDALRFALMAAGVGPGDAVVTVPNTFIATTEAISQVGAMPVFVDVDPNTCNMDPENLGEFMESTNHKVRAIIPVHLYGQPADMDPILEIAQNRNLTVIEDACQAHGARYKDQMAGSIGLAGCFSFYPGKNLGAYGEGGAVVTNDADTAGKIRMIRDHGQAQKYYHDMEGYNGRLDAIQAGVLRIKLKRLAGWNRARQQNASIYDKLLAGLPGLDIVRVNGFAQSVYHLYVIMVDNRAGLQQHLAEKGIATGLHYPLPLHLQKAYAKQGHREGDFPAAERCAERLLSLPMYPELAREQIEYVCACVEAFMKRREK